MVQLKSDIYRQQEFMDASLNAKREGMVDMGPSPMYERLAEMREKEHRRSSKKRGMPWMIIISLVSFGYFIMYGKDMMQESLPAIQQQVIQAQLQQQGMTGMQGMPPSTNLPQPIQASAQMEAQASNALTSMAPNEKATISITVGGQTITREMTLSEIQQMQAMSSGQIQ